MGVLDDGTFFAGKASLVLPAEVDDCDLSLITFTLIFVEVVICGLMKGANGCPVPDSPCRIFFLGGSLSSFAVESATVTAD